MITQQDFLHSLESALQLRAGFRSSDQAPVLPRLARHTRTRPVVPCTKRFEELPGIGWIRAATLFVYLDMPWRFANNRHCGNIWALAWSTGAVGGGWNKACRRSWRGRMWRGVCRRRYGACRKMAALPGWPRTSAVPQQVRGNSPGRSWPARPPRPGASRCYFGVSAPQSRRG